MKIVNKKRDMTNELILRFCIWDFDDISHDEITRLIGVEPCKIYIKGQKKNPNFSVLATYNGWLMNAPNCDKLSPFEEQLNSLLEVLEGKRDLLLLFSKKYTCEFSCAVYINDAKNDSTPSVHLPYRYNNLVGGLNIAFDLDLYCMADG